MPLTSNERPQAWPIDGGESGALVRAKDWGATALGPLEQWPESLNTIVGCVLACSFPKVLLWGSDLVQIYNDGYAALMGAKHPAGMGQATRECWPEVWKFNEPVYRRVVGGETLTFENQLFPISRHGFLEDAYFTLCYSPVRDRTGSVGGVLVTVSETTAQIKAEAARRQTEQDLRQMIDSMPQISWTADRDGRIIAFSRRWWQTTGLAEDEATPQSWMRGLWPEDVPGLREAWGRSLETGEPLDHEHRVRTVSGESCWMRSRAHPARDENGEIVRWYGTTEDIDERKRAEEALRSSEERYRELAQEAERQWTELETIYRTAPIGLALFDTEEFRYLRLNDRQASFFGLRPEEVVGGKLTELAPIEGLEALFQQVLQGRPVINHPLEGTLVTEPDKYRYWRVNYFPVYAADGSVRAITAASMEVTAQKKAEKALLQTEKLAAVGRLAASIAHEINNPLESVTNLIYLARRTTEMTQLQEYLEIAERELRRVAVISSQTLRFHKQLTSPRKVSCQELFGGVLSVFQGRIVNTDVEVATNFRADRMIECFDGEIRQVLSNLVANALDAMQTNGGYLLLRSRNATDWKTGTSGVVLTVADTGPGMSRDVQDQVFEAFYTTKGIGGTGLGLWVSQEIVDRHQGALYLRSSQSAFHHGTVFSVFLPTEAARRRPA